MCQRLWNDVKETYREYWQFVAKHKGNSVGESSRFSWITRQLKQDTKKKLESCKGEKKIKDWSSSEPYQGDKKVKKEDNN